MSIPILKAVSDQKVYRHSSITQNKNTLSVLKRGEWCPLVCDHIDYIDCDHIETHKTGISDKERIGYNFAVKECQLLSDIYLMGNLKETRTEALNTWFGIGFYESAENKNVLVNSDTNSLGMKNKQKLRVGLSYCLAEETLEAVE